MATFNVPVVKINNVEKHPNADRLTLVHIGGYRCVANLNDDGSWRYNAGDLVVYIPEGAVVPEWILRRGFWDEKNNKGMLAGPEGNRVKAIKLRNVISQGILFPVCTDEKNSFIEVWNDEIKSYEKRLVKEGDNVSELLGVIKYEPPIPEHLSGEVASIGYEHSFKFDVENLKSHLDVFKPDEIVFVSEKLHGTCCILGYIPNLNHKEMLDGCFIAGSKGLAAGGTYFKNNEANAGNRYQNTLIKMKETLKNVSDYLSDNDKPATVWILGEIFGQGVQDLHYGFKTPVFHAFDIYIGDAGKGRFLNPDEFSEICDKFEIDKVPTLYHGTFDMEKLNELKEGKTTFGETNVREGIVIRPENERRDETIGRVILKHVGDGYLSRKGKTTEFT